MNDQLHVVLDSSLPELDRLHEQFAGFAQRHGLSKEVHHAFQFALEELVTNIVTHGYGNVAGNPIQVEAAVADGEVVVQLEDRSPAFNPLEAPEPDFSISALDRKPGGLGLFLTKKMMDQMQYRHIDGKNQITLRKHF
jgi:anti-sigma regulatory factor (Ser/Thr protein kinase)